MAKISTYPSADTPLLLSDRLIGTEAIRPTPTPTPLATKNFSLGELLQLFSANITINTNLQQVLNAGNTATQNINLIGTIDATLIKPDNIEDTSGSQGLTFQFLSKGTSSINWVNLPVDNLQAVLNAGNTATQNITLVGNITSTTIFPGNVKDETSSYGLTGQLLSKTATGIKWINNPTSTTPGLADVLSVGNAATNNITLIGNIVATKAIPQNIQDEDGLIGSTGQLLSKTATGIKWIADGGLISLTTTGNSGPSTLVGSLLNVPEYTLSGLGGVSLLGSYADPTWITSLAYSKITGAPTIPTQYLTSALVDANIGDRLKPLDPNSNGFYFNRSFSGSVGYTALNTNTGNATVANLGVGIDSSSYIKNLFIAKFGPNYFVPLLAGKGALLGTEEVFVGSTDNNDFSVVTGTAFASITRKFTVKANGQLLIQTTPTTGTTSDFLLLRDTSGNVKQIAYPTIPSPGVTSVGLTVPPAFSVTPSTITSSGTFVITGAGLASQYVRGDGGLANFPTSTGGGASVSYYLNGSISQGTIGGVAYKEMNGTPVIGAGTDFTINTDGYIANFITDIGDPNKLLIPGGNWNFETYFSASSGGGSPQFYIELYKYDGTTFSLIASSSATPENITGGTSIDLYFTALAVPPTVLLATDRLAVRFYVIHSGRTITMHTENSHLSQIITTFSTGLTALNGLTSQVQYLQVGTSGSDFGISSSGYTHTFNLPTASAVNRGALSSTDWSAFNSKQGAISLTTLGTSGPSTLVGSTLNIPQYATGGSQAVGFSPQDVSSADTAPTAATTQYYYQTISTVTGTISKVKLWGFSGSDTVLFGLYRGTLNGTKTLIGQGSATCVIGPNEISLTAEVGQTLDLVVGENLIVGFYADGISWRTIYDLGISDAVFGITNTANITTMPATPTGTATGIRFACTLYS